MKNLVKINQHSLLFYTIIQFQIISLVVLIQSLHWTVKRLVLNKYIKLESGHHRLKLVGTKFSNHYARCKSRKKVIVNRRTYVGHSLLEKGDIGLSSSGKVEAAEDDIVDISETDVSNRLIAELLKM